jgi:hypothetical protein
VFSLWKYREILKYMYRTFQNNSAELAKTKGILWSAIIMLVSAFSAHGQTMSTSGDWNVSGNWTAGNIGDAVTETVTIANNVNPTVINATSFTVGNMALSQNNTLTINSGGTLNVGNSTNERDLTTNNNVNISVAGTLVIWGDLVVNNNLVWNITGTVIVKGNVQLNTNSNISVNGGTLTVGGNWTGNNNNNVSINSPGQINVSGNIDLGNGSNLNGCAGCFHVGGTCTGPSSFCNSGALPVELLSFAAFQKDFMITCKWSTASEKNFNYFVVEHSITGIQFDSIGFVQGAGESHTIRNYSFDHAAPSTGKNYYRLKSVDVDQSHEYSGLVVVELHLGNKVVIYPNPGPCDALKVRANFFSEEGDRIELYNSGGVRLLELGVNDTNMEIHPPLPLRPGLYIVRYHSRNAFETTRFFCE